MEKSQQLINDEVRARSQASGANEPDAVMHILQNMQLRHLFTQAPVALSILRGPQMIVEVANERILQLWGRSGEQVQNRPVFEAVPEAADQGYENVLSRVYNGGETIVLEESPLALIRDNKREELFIKVIYAPLKELDGTVSGVMVLADDITSQVIARKKLEESELRLRVAVEAAEMGTFDVDLKTSSFYGTDKTAKMFGFSSATELTNENLLNRIVPEDRPHRKMAHETAVQTGILFYEMRVTWPDGSLHWLRVSGRVVADTEGNVQRMYGTCLDITDDKSQAERLSILMNDRKATLAVKNEALKRSEERYHKMIDEIKDYAIILLDKDGIIQNWNQGAQNIKQYAASEAVGQHFRMFYLPDDRNDNLPEKLLKHATNFGRAIHEGWRQRKDGTRFWGSITLTALHGENNEVIGFSKVTRDLTEKKLADDRLRAYAEELERSNLALQKSEERYHKMIAEVQDYAIILLNDKGDIQNWNSGAEKIKGYSSSEIIGKNFRIFYSGEDREQGLPDRLLNEAATKGKAIHEGWRVRKDGSRFWGSIVLTALHSEDGSIIGFSKVSRDLTEKKLAEDKIQEYLLELEAQNKELEQFAYVASHDLQEPLRKIQTFADVIEKNFHNEPLARKYFSKINSSAGRMSELIKSVLNYSRLSDDRQGMVDCDLNVVLNNILADYELMIQEKNATVSAEILPTIKAMPLQVNQLFANLVGNSLKFTDKDPMITIASRVVPLESIENAPVHLRNGDYLELVFGDNGIGFDQQYEQLIFTMFQRLHAKHEYSGTGIGLALCKKIMDNHKGFITAKGEPGKGAAFFVYFPCD